MGGVCEVNLMGEQGSNVFNEVSSSLRTKCRPEQIIYRQVFIQILSRLDLTSSQRTCIIAQNATFWSHLKIRTLGQK